jgi:hypothetical protein
MKRGKSHSLFTHGDSVYKTTVSYIKDAAGQKTGYMEVVTNVTEIRQMERNMKQLNDVIMKSCNAVICNPDGIITEISENFPCVTGNPDRSVFLNKHVSEFTGENVYNEILPSIAKGESYESIRIINTVCGMKKMRCTFIPLCDKLGKPEQILLVVNHVND